MLAPLLLATAWLERQRLLPALPFFLASTLYFGMVHAAKEQHLHFQDGTFSLTAPFLLTEAHTIWRLFWVWGIIAIALLWVARRRYGLPWFAATLAWMFIVLLPYSFLTYQNTVPSRHTYLASAGVAILMGHVFATWRERLPDHRTMLAAVGVLYLVSQVVYLWIYKHPQYLERARPSEELIRAVQKYRGPVDVACFPYSVEVPHRAVEISTGGEAWINLADNDAPAGYALSINQCSLRSN